MFWGANLSGANLSGANLSGADLRKVNFSGANLKGADLSGVDFAGCCRPDAKLTGANLEGATADTNTDWPGDFDWKAAGVITTTATTTTTIQPLPGGFKIPPGDAIDETATLIDRGSYEINIEARNSGTEPAYYCIKMEYRLDDWDLMYNNAWSDEQGLSSLEWVTYGTDYSIPPDGQERVLILEKRLDWKAWAFAEYNGAFTYKIKKFEKLSSPC